MKLSGAIVLAACSLGCASLAQAEGPSPAPRMSSQNRKMAPRPNASALALPLATRIQTSLEDAKAASARRSDVQTASTAPKLNRFVSRARRSEILLRPAATLTPATRLAVIRR